MGTKVHQLLKGRKWMLLRLQILSGKEHKKDEDEELNQDMPGRH